MLVNGGQHKRGFFEQEAKLLFFSLAFFIIASFLVARIVIPWTLGRGERADAHLKVIARYLIMYRESICKYPDSLEQLDRFARDISGTGRNAIHLKDPWHRRYLFLKLSDKRVAIISTGANGVLDTETEDISTVPESNLLDTGEKGIFWLCGRGDDLIYIVDF